MANPAEDMSTGITIGWHTKVEDTFVEIAPTGGPSSIGAAALETPRRVPGDCAPVRHHDPSSEIAYEELKCVARVSGLEPGTEYRYRAGRDSFSPINRFRTATPGETFSFVYMSDVHVHNPIPRRGGSFGAVPAGKIGRRVRGWCTAVHDPRAISNLDLRGDQA